MKSLPRLLAEIGLLCGVSAAVALSVNSLRADNSLDLTRNYFVAAKVRSPKPSAAASQEAAAQRRAVESPDASPADTPPTSPGAGREVEGATGAPTPNVATADDTVQVIAFDEVCRLFEEPEKDAQGILFIDARSDELYTKGHIPGAVQLDHYKLDKHLPRVLPLAQSALTIIVYCNGGDCEDSRFAAYDLLDAGIPYERIHLYEGGWEEWTRRQMPVEGGRR